MLVAVLLTTAHAVTLEVDGACPGSTRVTLTDLTPGARFALFSGSPDRADALVPGGPCRGTPLALAAADLTQRNRAADDGDGTVYLELSLPLPACGLSVQAIDLLTCETSEAAPFVGVGGSELYLAASSGGASGLWRLDTGTGVTTFVGDPGVPITGMAFDDTGALFAVEGGHGSGAVIELDPETGEVLREVAALGLREAALTMRSGRLWVADQHTDLRTVDPATGAVSGPGWGRADRLARWGYALAASDTWILYLNDRTVHRVDPTTGNLTPLASVRGINGDGGGATYHNGELWFATDDGEGGTGLYIIDLLTGIAAPSGLAVDDATIDALASPTP